VPDTIEAVLLARMDRLGDDAKAVLNAASVLGRDVPLRELEALVLEIPTWRQHLRELQGLEYLHELGDRTHEGYRFKHALTQEVAYSSLPVPECQALHARVVEAIEQQYSAQLEQHTERLAHHAARGGLWSKAVGYLRQAGLRAARRAANHEATVWTR
jgi:predicted ATPase